MDEYIKKLDAFQAKNEFLNPCVVKNTNEETEYARAYAKGWNDCNSSFIDNIDKIPTADVQEVKHGKWIVRHRHEHYPSGKAYDENVCPFCKRADHNGDGIFCGYCGAKMDGKDDD